MELKPDWNRNKVSLSINWLKGKSASTIIYHHLPSSTIIYLYLRLKNMVSFKISLKQIQWLKAPTALQENPGSISLCSMGFARIAAWKKKRNDMWPCGCCMGKIYHHLIAPWMVVNILALGYEIPPKNDTYLDFCCVEILWNPPFCFLNVYIYVCVCSVCVCIRFASLCLCSIFWTAAVSGSVSQLSHRPSFSGRRHLETWKHIVK